MKLTEKILSRLVSIAVLALCLLVLLSPVGCKSATKEISRAAAVVTEQATATQADLDTAVATGEVGPAALPYIESASDRQEVIKKQAAGVQERVTQVRDVVPWWAQLLGGGFKAIVALLVAGAVVYVGFYFGVFKWIRLLLWRAGKFIPKSVWTEAKLDSEALIDGDDRAAREAVAARRAAYPEYDAAFQRVHRANKAKRSPR